MPVQCMSRKRTTVPDPGVKCAGTSAMSATWTRGAAARLRHHVNATIGFQELGGLTAKSPKSLMRMLGPDGKPRARHLFTIIGCLQEREGLELEVARAPVGAAGTRLS